MARLCERISARNIGVHSNADRKQGGAGFDLIVARRARRDMAWIGENLHTASRPTGAGNPIAYVQESGMERLYDPDVFRKLKAYDPTWEIVTMLLKQFGRVNTGPRGEPQYGQVNSSFLFNG